MTNKSSGGGGGGGGDATIIQTGPCRQHVESFISRPSLPLDHVPSLKAYESAHKDRTYFREAEGFLAMGTDKPYDSTYTQFWIHEFETHHLQPVLSAWALAQDPPWIGASLEELVGARHRRLPPPLQDFVHRVTNRLPILDAGTSSSSSLSVRDPAVDRFLSTVSSSRFKALYNVYNLMRAIAQLQRFSSSCPPSK